MITYMNSYHRYSVATSQETQKIHYCFQRNSEDWDLKTEAREECQRSKLISASLTALTVEYKLEEIPYVEAVEELRKNLENQKYHR